MENLGPRSALEISDALVDRERERRTHFSSRNAISTRLTSSKRSEKDPKTSYVICILHQFDPPRPQTHTHILHRQRLDDMLVRPLLQLDQANLVRKPVDRFRTARSRYPSHERDVGEEVGAAGGEGKGSAARVSGFAGEVEGRGERGEGDGVGVEEVEEAFERSVPARLCVSLGEPGRRRRTHEASVTMTSKRGRLSAGFPFVRALAPVEFLDDFLPFVGEGGATGASTKLPESPPRSLCARLDGC